MDVLRTGEQSPAEGSLIVQPPVGQAESGAAVLAPGQIEASRWLPRAAGEADDEANAQPGASSDLVAPADDSSPSALPAPPSYYRQPPDIPHVLAQEYALPVSPAAPGQARRFVNKYVEAQQFDGDEMVISLLVSEAVTNAVRHGFGSTSQTTEEGAVLPTIEQAAIWLGVACFAGSVLVAVLDKRRTTLKVDPLDVQRESNRGLQLINELAGGRWGYYFTEMGGKVVWFCIERMSRRGAQETPMAAAGS